MRSFCPILLAIAFMFVYSPAFARGIRLVSTKVVEDDGPDAYVLLNISTQVTDTDVNNPKGIDIWIRHPPGGHSEQPFLANKDGSIAAINIRPATKWEMVYLLLSFDDSGVTIISDFNAKIAQLCRAAKKDINEREIEVELIKGDVLSVWSSSYALATYNLQVRVRPSGKLRLLHHTRIPAMQ